MVVTQKRKADEDAHTPYNATTLSKATFDLQRDLLVCPNNACCLTGKLIWHITPKSIALVLKCVKCTKTFSPDKPFYFSKSSQSQSMLHSEDGNNDNNDIIKRNEDLERKLTELQKDHDKLTLILNGTQ